MEDFTLLMLAMGFLFTLLLFMSPKHKLIFGMLSIVIWFPMTSMVAVDSDPLVARWWGLFFGLAMICFVYVFLFVIGHIFGKIKPEGE